MIRIGNLAKVPVKGSTRVLLGMYGVGALIIRIGFGGILCYKHNKDPPNPCSDH